MPLAQETYTGAIVVPPDTARTLLARGPGLKLACDPNHYIAQQIPVSETPNLLRMRHIFTRATRIGRFQEKQTKSQGIFLTGSGCECILSRNTQ